MLCKMIKHILGRGGSQSTNKHRAFSVLLNITHKCNFACTYCFASHIRDYCTPVQGDKPLTMSYDMACQSVDYVFQRAKRESFPAVNLIFFGGEPLIEYTLLKRTYEYAQQLSRQQSTRCNAGIVTNGSLLTDDCVEFLVDNGFKVSVSMDGDKCVHDIHRRYPNGNGTYDSVASKVHRLTRRIADTSVVCTLTKESNVLENYLHFEQLGFSEMQIEVEHDFSVSKTYSDWEQHTIDLERQLLLLIYDRMAKRKPYMRYKPIEDLMDICKWGVTREYPECGAGVDMVCISNEGEIYPCGCFVGLAEFLMGNTKGPFRQSNAEYQISHCNVRNRTTCTSCVARDYCGGGCHFNAFHKHGTINAPAADCGRRKALITNFLEIFDMSLPV